MSDSDYASVSSDEIFPSGSTDGDTACVNITILDDDILEGDHTFTVTLTTLDPDVMLGSNEATITIIDNEGNLNECNSCMWYSMININPRPIPNVPRPHLHFHSCDSVNPSHSEYW